MGIRERQNSYTNTAMAIRKLRAMDLDEATGSKGTLCERDLRTEILLRVADRTFRVLDLEEARMLCNEMARQVRMTTGSTPDEVATILRAVVDMLIIVEASHVSHCLSSGQCVPRISPRLCALWRDSGRTRYVFGRDSNGRLRRRSGSDDEGSKGRRAP